MITINDDDLPITVAQKLITATRKCDDNSFIEKLGNLVGMECKPDMFTNEELYEISLYLGIYAKKQLGLEVEN